MPSSDHLERALEKTRKSSVEFEKFLKAEYQRHLNAGTKFLRIAVRYEKAVRTGAPISANDMKELIEEYVDLHKRYLAFAQANTKHAISQTNFSQALLVNLNEISKDISKLHSKKS